MIEYQYCKRCKRKLSNPESKKLGFGKVCYNKVHNTNNSFPLFSLGDVNKDNDNLGKLAI